MATEDTTGSDKNPTTDDESTTNHEYEPRADDYWVDDQFIGGRYDY